MEIYVVVTTDCSAVDEVRVFGSPDAAYRNIEQIAHELKARDTAHYHQITDHDSGRIVFAEDKTFSVELFKRSVEA